MTDVKIQVKGVSSQVKAELSNDARPTEETPTTIKSGERSSQGTANKRESQ